MVEMAETVVAAAMMAAAAMMTAKPQDRGLILPIYLIIYCNI